MYPVYEFLTVVVLILAFAVFLFATSAVLLAAAECAKFVGRSARAQAVKASTWAKNHRLEISRFRSVFDHLKS